MTTAAQIGWGTYTSYEGPFYRGSRKFSLPADPDETDKIIAVIAAAEGGCYDSINMYDRGIVSVGLIQWIEAGQRSVSDMLGCVAEKCGIEAVTVPLEQALKLSNASFEKTKESKWRFKFNDSRGFVDTDAKAQQLFLGCKGSVGSWTLDAKNHAKTWAACIANVWESSEACKAQSEYTRSRMSVFIRPSAKAILFDDDKSNEGWVGMIRAAYLSYAINNPTIANDQVKIASGRSKSLKWSEDWCICLLQQLTFGPNIAIYPARYNNVKGMLEKLWGVTLPCAKDLGTWKEPELPLSVPQNDPEVLSTVSNIPQPTEAETVSESTSGIFGLIQSIISAFGGQRNA